MEKLAATRIPVGERELQPSASIGIATFPQHAESLDRLIACADRAMYMAKKSGGGRAELCSGPGSALAAPCP